ncbi:hypothetical protein H4582DRAFT_145752 [Lactarius indigo]|nr:hypothetical protein H4582DRAFT_145752 [Lactarius indigo]
MWKPVGEEGVKGHNYRAIKTYKKKMRRNLTVLGPWRVPSWVTVLADLVANHASSSHTERRKHAMNSKAHISLIPYWAQEPSVWTLDGPSQKAGSGELEEPTRSGGTRTYSPTLFASTEALCRSSRRRTHRSKDGVPKGGEKGPGKRGGNSVKDVPVAAVATPSRFSDIARTHMYLSQERASERAARVVIAIACTATRGLGEARSSLERWRPAAEARAMHVGTFN